MNRLESSLACQYTQEEYAQHASRRFPLENIACAPREFRSVDALRRLVFHFVRPAACFVRFVESVVASKNTVNRGNTFAGTGRKIARVGVSKINSFSNNETRIKYAKKKTVTRDVSISGIC